jgi:hypothetical protein
VNVKGIMIGAIDSDNTLFRAVVVLRYAARGPRRREGAFETSLA